MTQTSAHYMEDDPQLLSLRLKRFVADIPAKTLSIQIGCDQRTAENIRQGHWPIARHWLGLVLAFGDDVTDAVFHPERAAARLEKELRDLEAELERKRAALRDVQGVRPGMAKAGPAVEDRAALEDPSFQSEDTKIVFLSKRGRQ